MIKYVFAAMVASSPVAAQDTRCASTADLYNLLMQKYEEERQTAGVADGGLIVEQWANRDTGSWTILATDVGSGMSCIVSDGSKYKYTVKPNV